LKALSGHCVIYFEEKSVFFNLPGIGNHLLLPVQYMSLSSYSEKQSICRALVMVTSPQSAHDETRFTGIFRDDALACEVLVKTLNENIKQGEIAALLTTTLLSLCRSARYRLLVSQVKDVLNVCLKGLDFHVQTHKSVAAEIVSLLWILLEEPSFHGSLIGGILESFQMSEDQITAMATSTSSNVNTLLNHAKRVMSGASMAMKLRCFLLFAALDHLS
jgi:hypothetical protein